MLYSGCQSKSKEISITEKICPQCGNPVELFSTDTEVTCDKCGFVIYNDMLSCVQWCKYARKCVGDQMYEQMMEIAKHNKEKAAKERAEKAAAKANKGIPGRQTLPGTALLVRLALREHVLQENAVALLGAVDKDVCDGSDEPAVL
ncbi:MAG: hypothetical protein V8T00_08975 [Oscillospiraceae bacterium]